MLPGEIEVVDRRQQQPRLGDDLGGPGPVVAVGGAEQVVTQLDRALVKERAGRLRETGKRLHEAHLVSMIGKREMILVENNGLAHTENFTLVDAAGLKPRDLVPVTITGHNGKHLTMRPETRLLA